MNIRYVVSEAREYARGYDGDLFHCVFCDAPYHFTTITKRFSKPTSVMNKYRENGAYLRICRGFMGNAWDGGDIAFEPETWAAFSNLRSTV